MYPLSGHEKYHFYILSQTGHQNNTIDILVSLDIKKCPIFISFELVKKKFNILYPLLKNIATIFNLSCLNTRFLFYHAKKKNKSF